MNELSAAKSKVVHEQPSLTKPGRPGREVMMSCHDMDSIRDSESDVEQKEEAALTDEGEGPEMKRRRVEDLIEENTLMTVVTNERSDDDSYEDEDSLDGEEDDSLEDGSGTEKSSFERVPSEVNVAIVDERDNDDVSCDNNSYSSSSSEDLGDEEEDDSLIEESDDGSLESECSDIDEMDSDSISSRAKGTIGDRTPPHVLFLPDDTSPTFETLKYEEDEDDCSDEEEPSPLYLRRTYMMGNNRGLRPRMMAQSPWDRAPCSVSLSSSSSTGSSSHGSSPSKSSMTSTQRKASRTGVSFNNSVTVYPVFETSAYSDVMIEQMYTKREELRVNKIRNKREFAFDLHDWRNATEEAEMDTDEDGELVHPVHAKREGSACQSNLQQHAPIYGSYQVGAPVVHRVKRMRMYYP